MHNFKYNWPTYLIFGGLIAGNVFYVLPLLLAHLAVTVTYLVMLGLGASLVALAGKLLS